MTDTRNPSYGQVDHDYGRRLATTDPADDGPVWMVNLMRYHDVGPQCRCSTTTNARTRWWRRRWRAWCRCNSVSTSVPR